MGYEAGFKHGVPGKAMIDSIVNISADEQARRAKLLAAMQEAQTCAYKHDTRGLYQVVKRIAPRQAYRRLQLRGDHGVSLGSRGT